MYKIHSDYFTTKGLTELLLCKKDLENYFLEFFLFSTCIQQYCGFKKK